MGQFAHSGSLLPDEFYSAEQEIVLPNGISGTYYVLVQTDQSNLVTETGAESNNATAAATNLTLAPYADLMVTGIVATSEIVIGSPAQIDVSWTVRNKGIGSGPVDVWLDRIVVSSNAVYGDADDRLVAEFGHSGALPAGSDYTRSQRVALPAGLSGQFTLFVATDATNTVYEYTFENDNVTAAPAPVLVRPLPFADLIVSNVTTPAAGSSGQALTIDWTITNQGTGTTNTASWYDRMVLSRDDQLGNGDDVTLLSKLHSGGLVPNGSYAATTDVVLPNGIEGDYYLFVIADATDVVDEFILEGNNTRRSDPISITLTPPPDLQVTSITVPVAALTAGVVDVSWQVTNRGVGSAEGNWLDRIYLSNDATVGGDQLLGSLAHTGRPGQREQLHWKHYRSCRNWPMALLHCGRHGRGRRSL